MSKKNKIKKGNQRKKKNRNSEVDLESSFKRRLHSLQLTLFFFFFTQARCYFCPLAAAESLQICFSLVKLLINSGALGLPIWMPYSYPYGFYRGQTTMWSLHSSNSQGNWIKRLLWFWSHFILQPLLSLSVCAPSASVSLAISEDSLCPPSPKGKKLTTISTALDCKWK